VHLTGLSSESNWSHALFPVDPKTGKRERRQPVIVLDNPDAVDAFFARQAR
jgi:hypothetical protein